MRTKRNRQRTVILAAVLAASAAATRVDASDGQAPAATAVTDANAGSYAPPITPPPPYSLPWQLRSVVPATAIRSDSSASFYDNPAGQGGDAVVTTLLATATS